MASGSWMELFVTKVTGWKPLLLSQRAPPGNLWYPAHASDHFRNFGILLHFLGSCVYGSRGTFAVVSANQWLSIDAGKHIG